MTRDEIVSTLAPVAKRILQIDAFTPETAMETTTSWTSLKHVQLLSAIEKAFSIRIGDADAFRLRSGERILAYLERSLAAK